MPLDHLLDSIDRLNNSILGAAMQAAEFTDTVKVLAAEKWLRDLDETKVRVLARQWLTDGWADDAWKASPVGNLRTGLAQLAPVLVSDALLNVTLGDVTPTLTPEVVSQLEHAYAFHTFG